MSAPNPELSVVILCYRAQEFVREFVRDMTQVLSRRGLHYELILVANFDAASQPPDRTPAVAAALAAQDPRITVVAKPKQGGMGWDMRSGIAEASGEAIAIIDGDGQIPPEDVLTVYETLRQRDLDLTKTYRTHRFDGFQRRLVSTIYNLALRSLFPAVAVRDANAKPKVLTRQALRRLTLESDGWFIDAEIMLRATYLGFRIGEGPATFYRNQHRTSFVKCDAILEFARELIRFRFKDLRRDAFLA